MEAHTAAQGEAERRLRELHALYDLSLAAASLDPDAILRLIGERIAELFNAAALFVALVDEEHDELCFAHCLDRGQVLAPFTVPLNQGSALTHYVLRTAEPLLIADLAAPPEGLPATPQHVGEAARSWLGVPLVVKGRAIGVMSVQSYAPAAFDENDQRLLSLAAQQAAAALENARLYQRTLALERRYHALLEALDDGYAVVQSGRVAFANARLHCMLGEGAEQVLADSLERLGIAAPEAGQAAHCRTRLARQDGSEVPVELSLSTIDYEGQPALAVICHDMSRQARLEAQLLQAEKLSAVGQLVSGVAHELNNPLTTIKGYAQLLQGEAVAPAVAEDLRKVEEAADRCRRIVRDLLTFARRYEPELTDTDINELLQRTVALRSYELRVRSIAVQWALDPALPTIQADPHRLQQVILNLVFNAEQAILSTAEEGCITIRSLALAGGQGVRFEVADTGPGIAPEHMGRIFDPFFTTKNVGDGAGLGLSTAYGIVKEHGGRIWAESRPGAGATFIVELPLAAETTNSG